MVVKRWRTPRIIWLIRRSRRLRPGRWPRPHAGRDRPFLNRRRISFHPPRPARPPRSRRPREYSMAWVYGATLLVAALILVRVSPPGKQSLPVTSPLYTRHASWLGNLFKGFGVGMSSAESWLGSGIGLMGVASSSRPAPFHWRSVMIAALSDVAGVPLTNLKGLLQLELPGMAKVAAKPAPPASPPPSAGPSTPAPTAPKAPSSSSDSKNAIIPGLPGAGGRVWAQLGTKPEVGIYQTHSRESFYPELTPGASTAYTTEWDKTVVQVGWWLAQDLHQQGVSVVQSRVDNMANGILASYNKSYYNAQKLLRWYPSVRMLIDLHRGDAVKTETTAAIHGEQTAKILIVVGTNKLLPNPYWHQNYEFALKLSRELDAIAPGILRGTGIETVPYRYNQQLMPRDLLIEVGGPNNTLAEERYAVNYLAEAIQAALKAPPAPPLPTPSPPSS